MARLALGTVQFGLDYGISNTHGQVSEAQARMMIDLARQAGLCTLDTAVMYGQSEQRLGAIGVSGFEVVTKLPAVPEPLESTAEITQWMSQEIEGSFARLNVSGVAGVLLHRPEQIMGAKRRAICAALDLVSQRYRLGKIGASVYDPQELGPLLDCYGFGCIQAPLSVIDQRLVSSGWIGKLKARGIEIHTRSAFLQGVLLMGFDALPPLFNPWGPVFAQWQAWCAANGYSKVEAALFYPLSIPEVDKVVVGATSPAELDQILAVATRPIPQNFPDIAQTDERLLNPSKWSTL